MKVLGRANVFHAVACSITQRNKGELMGLISLLMLQLIFAHLIHPLISEYSYSFNLSEKGIFLIFTQVLNSKEFPEKATY